MMIVTVHGRTDRGRVRKTNEDAFVVADLTTGTVVAEQTTVRLTVAERGVLLAVSDGMGGASAGEVASAMVLDSMRRSMGSSSTARLQPATEQANLDVWTASHEAGQAGMGATLTALHLCGSSVHIAEVGDSRAYLLRGGSLLQVTRDQSYVQSLVEAGVLTSKQAAESNFRNVILQAMGQKEEVAVAMGHLDLRRSDCFVLCSDGLSNYVSLEEMSHVILAAKHLEVACTNLVDLANQRGGKDNITVLIGVVGGDLAPLQAGETVAHALADLRR